MDERRLRITLSDDDQDRAKAYASEHGLRMPRAYGDLIRAGLEATSDDHTTDDGDTNDGN